VSMEAGKCDAFKVGDFIIEGGLTSDAGIVLSCGPKTYDVVWRGGSTTRYRHGQRDNVRLATAVEIDGFGTYVREDLIKDAATAREERRTGARIKRGQVWPSR
jgi:hypothetical protein